MSLTDIGILLNILLLGFIGDKRERKGAFSPGSLYAGLSRYFLKTIVYTPPTPCRDGKFPQHTPLGDLS